MMNTRNFTRTLIAGGLLAIGLTAHAAAELPGKGVKVQPLQSAIAEETFQTLLVSRGLEKLGFDVQPIQEIEAATGHVAISNGDATFLADHWDPLHADFYKNGGGEAKLFRQGVYSSNAAQGYLIDKKTAEKYNITHIDQLKDPELAKLFDATGDGKADLTGCNPGWGCELVIEHQLTAFGLRDTVSHAQGSYSALIANTITRFNTGEPVLYYTWTPYWVSGVLRPGQEVVWLEVPYSSLPGEQAKLDTQLPNGKNYGFTLNTQRIVANKTFTDSNPSAAKLFEIMQLPVGDINAQNERMKNGENSQQQIEEHTDAWIKGHQQTFDSWIAQALAAANH
jgi:glycine betaine/proline transport system substrate-binding protein